MKMVVNISWMLGCFFFLLKGRIQFEVISWPVVGNMDVKETWMLFAADEKTEDPTPKKLSDARKKGQVVKSTDLNSVIILIVLGLLIVSLGDTIFSNIEKFLKVSLNRDMNVLFTMGNLTSLFIGLMLQYFKITAPFFASVLLIGVLANLLQTGFLQSPDPLKPDFKKLNPIEGFKKIFSKKALFDFAKTFLKLLLAGFTSYLFIKKNLKTFFTFTQLNILGIFPLFKDIVQTILFRIAFVLGILAIIDFIYQKYEFNKNLKMTKHEVKEEMKQMEGDPQIKSKRKQKQRQMAMSRMMADVPKATVIVTNPTHLAIGLKYESGGDQAPVMIAKGADLVAQRIREIAKGQDIPIIENKPLARILYRKLEVGDEIPMELYQAVAEILAIVYQMKESKGVNYQKRRVSN